MITGRVVGLIGQVHGHPSAEHPFRQRLLELACQTLEVRRASFRDQPIKQLPRDAIVMRRRQTSLLPQVVSYGPQTQNSLQAWSGGSEYAASPQLLLMSWPILRLNPLPIAAIHNATPPALIGQIPVERST